MPNHGSGGQSKASTLGARLTAAMAALALSASCSLLVGPAAASANDPI